eukprot:TRINITY_DN13697_c1_g1_i1.p1 TRINITY_DN13697_c1_g1~~TRINITY_DN13697_c1_g1_i1.p1  ORF type:complete len:250 (+),score=43.81 TRINITY_DN13697_c1_g1_i1:55-804(+)
MSTNDARTQREVTTIVNKATEHAAASTDGSRQTSASVGANPEGREPAASEGAKPKDKEPVASKGAKPEDVRPKRRPGGGMARMFRHISGKRDFDLFATPFTDERLFTKKDLQEVLRTVSARHLSPKIQDLLSEIDSPMHFYDVGLDVLFNAITEHGFPHARLEDAVLEVLSHRYDYMSDSAMQTWMCENLLHVKYDFAAAGTLAVGEIVPAMDEQILVSLDNGLEPKSLRSLLLSGAGRPLVILAGSWT